MSQQDVDEMLARREARGSDAGGGGTAAVGADAPPAEPHELDDEFDGDELSDDWTPSTANTPPETRIENSYLIADFGAANGAIDLVKDAPIGSADFSVAAKFSNPAYQNYKAVMLFAFDAAQSDGIRVAHYNDTLYAHEFPAFAGAGSGALAEDDIFVMMQRVAGTWSFGFSRNGISWRPFGLGSVKSFNVAKVRLSLTQSGSTSRMRQGVDWVRFNYAWL
jgi:hypothetical protein